MSDLAIGTRIVFTRTLTCGATGDHPAFLFAECGQGGEITDFDARRSPYPYSVKADGWPTPFAAARDEFKAEDESKTI